MTNEGITQRQCYLSTVNKFLSKQRFSHHLKRKIEAIVALKNYEQVGTKISREPIRSISRNCLGLQQDNYSVKKRQPYNQSL